MAVRLSSTLNRLNKSSNKSDNNWPALRVKSALQWKREAFRFNHFSQVFVYYFWCLTTFPSTFFVCLFLFFFQIHTGVPSYSSPIRSLPSEMGILISVYPLSPESRLTSLYTQWKLSHIVPIEGPYNSKRLFP